MAKKPEPAEDSKPKYVPPPPPPADGSPPYLLCINGKKPIPYRDFIDCLVILRGLCINIIVPITIVRVVDGAVLAFTARGGMSVKKAAQTAHLHREPKARKGSKKNGKGAKLP